MPKIRLLIVLGTRPEAIKLAPIVLDARRRPDFDVTLCCTGQHADLCHDSLSIFGIRPDLDLAIMRPNQSLPGVAAAVLSAMEPLLAGRGFDWLVVQGDTSSAFAAALAGFYAHIAVAHVEAGLRTGDIDAPWPEEMNRRLISAIARIHFAPLAANALNLEREGIAADSICVTGNTGIDALKWLVRRLADDPALARRAQDALDRSGVAALREDATARLVLITAHRRESFGEGFRDMCAAVAELAARFPDRHFVYPVHPNPAVREAVASMLGNAPPANVHLIEPLDYLAFVRLMTRAELILTDSGGIQEEAPSIGKRVIVMRRVTEREDGLATGMIRVAGTDPARIVGDAADAFAGRWPSPDRPSDVYGDGRAASRILDALARRRR